MNEIMKANIWKLLFLFCSVIVLSACDTDDDLPSSKVPETVKSAFDAKFPTVNRVEWEKKSGYYVAEFHENGVEMQTWFDTDAVWCMTETDLRTDLNGLPGLVQSAFQTGEYADWRVNDIDKYERPAGVFYLIEIEKNGQKDRDLFYDENGTLLKDVVDTEKDTVLPNISFN